MLASITHRLKSTLVNRFDKGVISDKPFDISNSAFHRAAFLRLAKGQHLGQTNLGCQVIGQMRLATKPARPR